MTKQPNNASTAGTTLSEEQIAAIEHILETKDLFEIVRATARSKRRDAVLLMTLFDYIGFGDDFDSWGPEGFVAADGLKDPKGMYKKAVSDIAYWFDVLGTPPAEAFLYIDDGSRFEQEVAQFRRARHQIVCTCSECGGVSRYVVGWTAEGGHVYPEPQECTVCLATGCLEPFGEVYIKQMPYPFKFDPEPERRRGLRNRKNPESVYLARYRSAKAAAAATES